LGIALHTDIVIQLGKRAVTLLLAWDYMKIGHWLSGVSVSAPPLVWKTASLIEKETAEVIDIM